MDACNKNTEVLFLSLDFSGHQIVLRQTRKTGCRKKNWRKEVCLLRCHWNILMEKCSWKLNEFDLEFCSSSGKALGL